MAKATTPSFITEVELRPTPSQAKKLRSKFEAARLVYNACLGESLRRLKRLRDSRLYQKARKIPKQEQARRTAAFRAATEAARFREYDITGFTVQFTSTWINEHIGCRTCEAIAKQAFKAAQEHSLGKRGRPRFRRKGELLAVEGKVGSCCRWKGDRIKWKGLTIPAIVDQSDAVLMHGLSRPVKYVRMVRKVIRKRERFFAQLVGAGAAFKKPTHKPARGIVGLDVGPQTIAMVGESSATLEVFGAELESAQKQIAALRRKMKRSERATNPDNDKPDGTQQQRAQKWIRSKAYRRTMHRAAELARKQVDQRKNLHGRLVARVLNLGDDIRTEKPEYTAFQKLFGKSGGYGAPGTFIARLKIQATKWGATVTEFSARSTKLGETCCCGRVKPKRWAERWHNCECGVIAQRDLFSAYLARFVARDRLDAGRAAAAWPGACAAIDAAFNRIPQRAIGGPLPSSLGLPRVSSQSRRIENGGQNLGETQDVVAGVKTSCESLSGALGESSTQRLSGTDFDKSANEPSSYG